MATKDEVFQLREIALAAFKGMAKTTRPFEYKTIFYTPNGDMEKTKMFEGLFFEKKFFEFKLTRKRDPIADRLAPFSGVRDVRKTAIMNSYLEFVNNFYFSLFRVSSTTDRIFIRHCEVDYEITFVEKRSVSYE